MLPKSILRNKSNPVTCIHSIKADSDSFFSSYPYQYRQEGASGGAILVQQQEKHCQASGWKLTATNTRQKFISSAASEQPMQQKTSN
ncbi:hypothetical protein NPIL_680151 [Nephila pilipes]|uniref:Uncharacterized protein n=1 Tax=Nephila pilipes TaxID=299642 RepID=A0A8X6QHE3_NEPPI|nr:hypothetical protein NPIL_680151 [Nephila pilipes]